MPVYAKRRRALIESVCSDAFLARNHEGSDPVSIRYLTGFTGEGILVLTEDGATLLTDSRYDEQARRESPDLEILVDRRWTADGLIGMLRERAFERVLIPSARVTHHWATSLRDAGIADIITEKDPVAQLRRVKDSEEIDALRQAAAIADRGLAELLDEIKVGMDEAEIALRLEFLLRRFDVDGVAFEINVSAGANTALNHYRPTMERRRTEPGNLLLFDFGVCWRGYRSDITRTVSVGRPTEEARRIYDLVLGANRAGINAVRPGATGIEVDAVARDRITAAGHGAHFGHGLGHGIGLEVHEAPTLSPLSEDTLEVGMVVTVEPGVYLSGFGGVRIEDDVVVTRDGSEVLTGSPKDRLLEVG